MASKQGQITLKKSVLEWLDSRRNRLTGARQRDVSYSKTLEDIKKELEHL